MKPNASPPPSEQTPKTDRFTVSISLIIIVMFLALLLTPLVLLLTTGQDKAVMEGEKQYERPNFSLIGFFTGDFQSDFEMWFSTKYPLRSKFVSAYRRLEYQSSNIGFNIGSLFLPAVTTPPPDLTPPPSSDTLAPGNTQNSIPVKPPSPFSDFNPLYTFMNERLYQRLAQEPTGYKGTAQVIIGKSGYLYENGYINEYYGYTQKYYNCTDSYLQERADMLAYI